MEKFTKRGFLKATGITTGALLASGTASAAQTATNTKKIRLRGDKSNPLSYSQIWGEKKSLLEDSDVYASRSNIPIARNNLPSSDYKVLAYNFDIIDGVATEWSGIYKNSGGESTATDNESTATTSTADLGTAGDPVGRIFAAAKEDVEKRDERHTSSTTSVTTASTTSYSTSSVADWSSWDIDTESDNLIVTSDGNDMSWESKWKYNPNDTTQQGINSELTVRPYTDGLYPWTNNDCSIRSEFNEAKIDEIADYGPPNTITSETTSYTLGFTGNAVEVGASTSITSPDLVVSNHSDTDAYHVDHSYDINGGLEDNTVRVNQAAVTSGTRLGDVISGSQLYCTIELDAWFSSYNIGYDTNHGNKTIEFGFF